MKTTLPTSWRSVKLGDVAQVNPTKPSTVRDMDSDLEVSFVPMKAVDEHLGKITNQEIKKLKSVSKGYTYFQNNWVLFAKITPCMENGKSAVARDLVNGIGFGSTEFHTIVPSDEIIPEYIYHYLRQEKYRYDAKLSFRGAVGQQRVPPEFIRDTVIPLPEINEQKKIVEKIEELFSVIESVSNSLGYVKKATTNLGNKLLFDSFNGKLTEDWRDNHNVNETGLELAKKYTQKVIIDKMLPDTWVRVRIGDIFGVYVGSTPSRKEKSYWGGDISWVSSGEVSFCRIKETKETITQLGYDNSSTKIHPVGTVLLGMIGEGKTRGQVAILDIAATHNQNSAAIRVSETSVLPEYVYYFFQSEYQKTRQIGSGNNQKALNKTRVSDIEIPIPPAEEQQVIVDLLGTYFSNLEAIKNDLDVSKKVKIQSLKQSILKQAFEGKLV